MNFRILCIFLFVFFLSCENRNKEINYTKNFKNYSNKGFALIYDDLLYKNKSINKKIKNRSLVILNRSLENETPVKVTNLINGKYLLAKVNNTSKYPIFYNAVISKRIAADLEIDNNEPYVEIKTLNQNKSFIISKAKTFEEEKKVANKVPIEGIEIKDLAISKIKNKKILKKPKSNNNFKYIIKIADFYFENSAEVLKKRLELEYNIKDLKIKKVSKNSYRIFKGPYINLESIKEQYNDIINLKFENIEIIKL